MDKDITLEQEFDLVFKAHYSLGKHSLYGCAFLFPL